MLSTTRSSTDRVTYRPDGRHDMYMHWGFEIGNEMVALCGYTRALPVTTYERAPRGRSVCPTCAADAQEMAGYGEW